jgi:hypothetical protein
MASFDIWKTVTGSAPNLMLERWSYDTITTVVTYIGPVNIGSTPLGSYHPASGTLFYDECISGDQVLYYGIGNNTGVSITTNLGYPGCCTLYVTDFAVVKTNNTSLLIPNGTIVITAPIIDITLYEASIDGGANYIGAADGAITFEDLPAGEYTIIIREVSGSCFVTTTITVVDSITYPPPIVSETTLPSLYSPVFYPITIGYKLTNNDATVKQDGVGTYLEVSTSDGRDYLGSLPIINIFDNSDYAGTYQITGVDDTLTPTKFYLDLTYITDQSILFVPFDREIFQLFAEVEYNNYQKIADISVYPDPNTGEYLIRLEGFLKSVFEVVQPQNNGIEITLLRKYYVVPYNFDMDYAPTILNAVYSAIPDLTNYLGSLIPLGPAPINFINEQTQKGLPVLFSYIELTTGRVMNITSSDQTNIASSSPTVFISALPLNEYTLTWINPLGAIGSLVIDPALPSWITLETSPSDTVLLTIITSDDSLTGDYDGSDYSGTDYLTGGPNAIVGCYSFEFSDGVDLLFTLEICIYPLQKSNGLCPANTVNIAWVNREGGWSSYVFDGRKTYGKEIGTVNTYKLATELKRSTVEDVYDVVEVNINNKAKRDLIFISSLRQSIQAYLFDDNTLQWSIPIFIDKDSFPIYSIPFKQVEVSDKFTFRIANEVIIQSQ